MSTIDDALKRSDRIDRVGAKLLSDANINFDKYAALEESAKVIPAERFEAQVAGHFRDPSVDKGNTLPWSKTHNAV